MKIKIDILIKLVLSVLFFICLLDMPYGYFQLVRFVAMCGFAYLAFLSNKSGQQNVTFIYIALAILFQPFIKIALGRSLWNIVDMAVGIWLLYSVYNDYQKIK